MRALLRLVRNLQAFWARQEATRVPAALLDTTPLDLRLLGRTLARAALVGVLCGLLGAAFFWSLELAQFLLLEQTAGYVPLRAHGEMIAGGEDRPRFRPWLLPLIPALGGLMAGLVCLWAPEARGGGGDVLIRAVHEGNSLLRPILVPVKMLASILTLGTGGAGGREGPTMLVGGAAGSITARLLGVDARERRVLLIAGVAAGISAVFRTPLGAALLAVEVLYRDGFESEALVPAVLASVVSYSVVISIFGESTLLAHAPRYLFVPAHLPLFLLMTVLVCLLAVAYLNALQIVRSLSARSGLPQWLRPAMGGLLLGLLATALVVGLGGAVTRPGEGLGVLGGGYGAAQVAITGAPWLPAGWGGVALLGLLAVAKVLASALTIGSGGSAGDFAPSLAIGALAGGTFGRAAQLIMQDPRLDPGQFALVGMGAFYGGAAHVPLSALVLVCEMAGNYDLLVPLMLSLAVAFVLMRRHTLYESQALSPRS